MIEASKTNFREMGRAGAGNIDWIVEQVKNRRKEAQMSADHDAIFQDKVYMKRLFETLVEKRGYDSNNLSADQAQEVADELYHTIDMADGFGGGEAKKAMVEKVIGGVQKVRSNE